MAAANDARGFQGKLPPQNLEAEMGVLGSILLMHEAIDVVGDVHTRRHNVGAEVGRLRRELFGDRQ